MLDQATTDAMSTGALLEERPKRPTPFSDILTFGFENVVSTRSSRNRRTAKWIEANRDRLGVYAAELNKDYVDEIINWAEGHRSTLPVYDTWEGTAKLEFNRVVANPHYTPYHAEKELLVSLHDYFGDKAKDLRKHSGQKILLHELGADETGFAKSNITINAFQPDYYNPINITIDAVNVAGRARSIYPSITCTGQAFTNYDTDKFNGAPDGLPVNSVIAQYGIPQLNTEGLPNNAFPYHDVVRGLLHYRKNQNAGDIFIQSFDSCDDQAQLDLMYDPAFGNKNLCRALLGGVPMGVGPLLRGKFDMDAFRHCGKFNKEARVYEQGHVMLRDVNFSILGKKYSFKKGDFKGCAQMWRPRINDYERVFLPSGYRVIDRFDHKNGHTHMFVCQAI